MSARDTPQPTHPASAIAQLYEQIRSLRTEMKRMIEADRARLLADEALITTLQGYRPDLPIVGGVALPFYDVATTGVEDWGGISLDGLPSIPLNIAVVVTGFVRNFTAGAFGKTQIYLTTTGTFGAPPFFSGLNVEWTLTGGGSADNRKAIANSFALLNATPTGKVNAKVQVQANHVDTVFQSGFITMIVTPPRAGLVFAAEAL